VQSIGDFPFMLSLVEAFLGFFSRISKKYLTRKMIFGRVSFAGAIAAVWTPSSYTLRCVSLSNSVSPTQPKAIAPARLRQATS
jgi:hypothetical protein